jgi:hypothetical protein
MLTPLTVVPPYERDRLADARELLRLAEYTRAATLWLCGLLPLVLGVVLMLSGLHWGGLLVGGAVSLALSRYGPSWWPGRR